MMLAFGLLAAVLAARSTGQGQVIDAAMTDGASVIAAMIHGFRAAGAWTDAREANLLDGGAYFYTTYPCADGRHIAVGCIEPQFHAAMLRELGLHGLGLDPAGFDQADRASWPAARARLASVFATQPRDHWAALFAGSDACVTPVLGWDEAQAHPQNAERGAFVTLGGVVQPAPAPRFSATPAPVPTAPALPDPATLTRWGIAPDRIAALTALGVLAHWPEPEIPNV